MKTVQSIHTKKKLYLQKFQERLFLSNILKKKFLTIKHYIYNIDCWKLKKKYKDGENITNPISKKNTIYNSDLFILNHYFEILSLNFNEIMKYEFLSEIESDIVTVPHYAFVSINKNWYHSTTLVSSTIPQYLHPEIITRMVNIHIKDNTFVDLLRRGLHLISQKSHYLNENIQQTLSYYINGILYFFLEIEFDFFIKKEMCSFMNEFQFLYNKKKSFLLKKKYLIPLVKLTRNTHIKNLDHFFIENIEKKFIKYSNYLRFKHKWLLTIHNDILIINLFKYRCIKFWKNRVGICLQNQKLSLIKLNSNNFFFLGIVLKQNHSKVIVTITLPSKQLLLKNKMQYNFLVIKIPISHIIHILCKYGICDKNGYPISKSSWSIWSDFQIINRFHQIFFSIYLYYNGCVNRKKLSNIHYILCYSCGKTLACKHKTTLRSIWYQYSKTIFQIDFFRKNQFDITKYFYGKNKFFFEKNVTTWYVDYVNYDSIISLLIE